MSKGTIIVSGALANKPHNGGEAWVRLNWLLGFRELGFDVWFIEQIARGGGTDAACAYFEKITGDFGFAGRAALIADDGEMLHGPAMSELCDVADVAELLVNISGHLRIEPLFSRIRRKAYVDIDPGFTQFWHASGNRGARLEGHDVFFTIGENIGSPGCPIPTCGVEWHATRPPITLKHWPVINGEFEKFTTVASWRGAFGPVEFDGKTYGLKVHEFRKFIELPQRAALPFEIALNIHPADQKDRDALQHHGWRIVEPDAAADPDAYRCYIQNSSAEFSVAQGIYVQTGSGWFSDRTAAYLASGKPALVQDTGFTRNLPVGEGLIAFRTLEEAIDGAKRIAGDYARHSKAARALAETYFDSEKVLSRLLEEIA